MAILKKIILVFVLAMGMMWITPISEVNGQCAMCSLNAENSTKEGNMQGKGLNNGILFLLAMPFLIGAGVGILWYKKFRVPSKEVSSGNL